MLSQKILLRDKRILICPLDWGLGHTARCVPLIKHLLSQNNTVTVGCNENQKTFLSNEISNVEYVELFGYDVRYSGRFPLWMKMLFQFPRLYFTVRKENRWLKKFLVKNKPNRYDVVISDNRFGLYSKKTENIFITHQLIVKAPFLQSAVNYINRNFIKKFDQCWIPDLEEKEKSLAGELSHGKNVSRKITYVGPLSRLDSHKNFSIPKTDVLLLLSGVEPQRALLEEKLVTVFKNTALNISLVRGTNIPAKKIFPQNFSVSDVATTVQLQELLNNSSNIICRSGYSTLMDLYTVELKAILIPTPGQTEQEYLAQYWSDKFGFKMIKQDDLTGKDVLNLLEKNQSFHRHAQ